MKLSSYLEGELIQTKGNNIYHIHDGKLYTLDGDLSPRKLTLDEDIRIIKLTCDTINGCEECPIKYYDCGAHDSNDIIEIISDCKDKAVRNVFVNKITQYLKEKLNETK